MTMHNEPTQPATPEECAPVQELWFEDGNLILKAESSLFRIYSGFLAARSSVFRDMVAFPPPEGGNDMMDGCPIVTVYDSAKDMSHFLMAIFDSSYFEPPPAPTELPIVEGILRLSLKYDVQFLKRRALFHLVSTFPMTLADWKSRDSKRTIPPVDNTPFAAFRIAREFDLDWLMPSIYYCISSHPFEKTLDHAPWGEETISFRWPDKRAAIVGRQKLIGMQCQNAMTMVKVASSEVEGCTGHSCAATRLQCANILSSWDMAGFLDYFEDNANVYSDFCLVCRISFKETCLGASQHMWSELPNMFSLPSWDDLEKSKAFSFE